MTNSGHCPNTANFYSPDKLTMMKKIILSVLLIQIVLVCNVLGQINVLRIDNNAAPQTKEGIFYSLPRTVVKSM
jgi:hypothetical protein